MNDNKKLNFKSENEVNIFLDEVISQVKQIVKDDTMNNKCDMCQGLIGRFFDKLGILYYPCSTEKVISSNVVGHSFIVADICDNDYLIDPAFVQFKYNEGNDIVISGIKCVSKSPYFYLNIINNKLANNLVNKGYFKLDEESAFYYGNSFYFTKTNIPSNLECVPISGDIFINSFKSGDDSLKNYNIGDIELNNEIIKKL